ncbi:MAG: rhamnulokinase [Promethearchaeota archaeon]
MGSYLAIDIGAESGRFVGGQLVDEKLSLEELYRFRTQGTEILGRLYWNLMRFYDEIIEGLRLNAGRMGDEKLDGIGIDTWGVDFVLLDEQDQLISSPFHYRDKVMASYEKPFTADFDPLELYSITGMQQLPFNSAVQLYALQREEHCSLKHGKTFLMIPDYFNFLLTGNKMVEYTDASTTQLLDARTKKWHGPLLEQLNLPLGLFPTPAMPGQPLGTVHESVLASAPVLKDVAVHLIGSHDTASAVIGCPLKNDHSAYLSSGTWSLLGMELKEPVLTRDAMESHFTNEGGFGGMIRFLRNIMGLWLLQRCKSTWEMQRNVSITYDTIIHDAKENAGLDVLVDPDDPRFLNPSDMLEEIRLYCRETGQPVPKKIGEFSEIIFKSLALKYRQVIESMEKVTGKAVEQLHVVGGGSKNAHLCQYTAEAINRPVIAGPDEASATGNIIIQAISTGEVKDVKEGRDIIINSFTPTTYTPSSPGRWDDIYQSTYLPLVKGK